MLISFSLNCVKLPSLIKRFMKPLKDIPIDLSDRVYLVIGGTGSLGSQVVTELAKRGAQIILLCRDTTEPKVNVFVSTLQENFGNKKIFAVSCDLSDYLSADEFLSTWVETERIKRLDGIVFCASGTSKKPKSYWGSKTNNVLLINYLSHRDL